VLVQFAFFKVGVSFMDFFHKESGVKLLALMDEAITDLVFEQLEGESSSIEAKERRCACNFSIEDIHIVHHILLRIALHKGNCSTSWEGRLGVLYDILSRNQYATGLCSSQIFMRTHKCEIDLIKYLEIEFMMTAIGCTIHTEHNTLMLFNFFCIENEVLMTALSAERSVILEVTFDAAEAETMIS
jgi:hypothetical protein